MNRKFAGLLLILLVVLLPACSMKEAAGRMGLELKEVHMKDVMPQGFSATVTMQVTNGNSFDVQVADLDYKAEINGTQVAEGRIEHEIDIPSHGAALAELPLEVRCGSLGNRFFDVLLKDRPQYRVSGDIVFKTWFGKYPVHFDTTKKGKKLL